MANRRDEERVGRRARDGDQERRFEERKRRSKSMPHADACDQLFY